MAKADETKTYGVGDSTEKKNVGASVDAVSIQDEYGKVYDKGELVFDPTDDAIEIEQEDGYDEEPDEDKGEDKK